MKKISTLFLGILIGASSVYLPFSCNNSKNVTSTPEKIFSIDDPEKDSFINYRDADTMQQRYLSDSRRFLFSYHDDPTHPDHSINDVFRGVIVSKKSLDSLAKLTSCDKFYLMYGINLQKRRQNPYVIDNLLTTVVVPVKTEITANGVYYHIAKDLTKTSGDTTALEYNSPCPPYCPQ